MSPTVPVERTCLGWHGVDADHTRRASGRISISRSRPSREGELRAIPRGKSPPGSDYAGTSVNEKA